MAGNPVSLEVGETIRLEHVMDNVHYCTNVNLIGYADGQRLIVSYPKTELSLSVGDEMVARFVTGDKVFAFQTKIIKLNKMPYQYMHLDYPIGVQGKMTRRGVRVPVKPRSIGLTMHDGQEELKVSLADLSGSGARLVAPKRLGQIDDKFMIDMQIPYSSQVITLPCVIRYIRSDLCVDKTSISTSYHHGVSFDGLADEALSFIESFVADRINNIYTLRN